MSIARLLDRARCSPNANGTVCVSGSLPEINFIKAAGQALRAGRDNARNASKARSDFIAMMRHQLNAPFMAGQTSGHWRDADAA